MTCRHDTKIATEKWSGEGIKVTCSSCGEDITHEEPTENAQSQVDICRQIGKEILKLFEEHDLTRNQGMNALINLYGVIASNQLEKARKTDRTYILKCIASHFTLILNDLKNITEKLNKKERGK